MAKYDPEAIFAARKKLGLTRLQLSEESGVCTTTIFRIEKQGIYVRMKTWEKLTETLERMARNAAKTKKVAKKA